MGCAPTLGEVMIPMRRQVFGALGTALLSVLVGCSSPDVASNARDNGDDDVSSSKKKSSDDDATSQESDLKKTPETKDSSEGGPCSSSQKCVAGLTCKVSGSETSGTCQKTVLGDERAICGGPSNLGCRADLVCNRSSSQADANGVCQKNAPAAEGEMCGGSAKINCTSGLSCQLASNQSGASGICRKDNKPSTDFCKQLSQCCGSLPDLFQQLACGGTVAYGNETTCAVELAVCEGGGI